MSDSQQICFPNACPTRPSQLTENFLHLHHHLVKSFTGLSAPGFHSWLVIVSSPPIHLDIKLILPSMLHFTLIYIEFYLPFYFLWESLHKICLCQKVPIKSTKPSTTKKQSMHSKVLFITVCIQISSPSILYSLLLLYSLLVCTMVQGKVHTWLRTALYRRRPR